MPLQDLLYGNPIPDTARRGVVGVVKNGLYCLTKLSCHQDVDKLLTSSTDVQSGVFMVEGSSVSEASEGLRCLLADPVLAHLDVK